MDEFFKTRMGHQFFQATLPRLVEQISRLADGVAALNDTSAAIPRILLVDDDEQILRGLGRGLKQDHDILLATSPALALAMAEAQTLDAVVTDHDLGDDEGRNGTWLLDQVRQRWPDARRILMSGGSTAIEEHVASGLFVRFLPKPVGAEDVRAALQVKACIKCGVEVTAPQLQGDERCARCGDEP